MFGGLDAAARCFEALFDFEELVDEGVEDEMAELCLHFLRRRLQSEQAPSRRFCLYAAFSAAVMHRRLWILASGLLGSAQTVVRSS